MQVNKKSTLPTLLLLLIIAGASCAMQRKTITLGTITGATMGATSGALIASHRKGDAALTVGALAALLGASAGYFIHQEFEQERERTRRQTLLNLEQYGFQGKFEGEDTPLVAPPVVEQYDVNAKVDGKKLIGPHKVWMIKEGAKWKLDGTDEKPQSQTNEEASHD